MRMRKMRKLSPWTLKVLNFGLYFFHSLLAEWTVIFWYFPAMPWQIQHSEIKMFMNTSVYTFPQMPQQTNSMTDDYSHSFSCSLSPNPVLCKYSGKSSMRVRIMDCSICETVSHISETGVLLPPHASCEP